MRPDASFSRLLRHRPAATAARQPWARRVVAAGERAWALHRAAEGRPPSYSAMFRCVEAGGAGAPAGGDATEADDRAAPRLHEGLR